MEQSWHEGRGFRLQKAQCWVWNEEPVALCLGSPCLKGCKDFLAELRRGHCCWPWPPLAPTLISQATTQGGRKVLLQSYRQLS